MEDLTNKEICSILELVDDAIVCDKEYINDCLDKGGRELDNISYLHEILQNTIKLVQVRDKLRGVL